MDKKNFTASSLIKRGKHQDGKSAAVGEGG